MYVDLLYRAVGLRPLSFRAILLYSLVAGIAGTLVDIDHLIINPFLWQYPIYYDPVWHAFLGRPLHIPILIISILLIGRHLARNRRLPGGNVLGTGNLED